MDNWDIESIKVALDDALVTVAHECWFQLTGELITTDSQLNAARRVESSLESLRLLQSGGIPTYNDWDALFYLTWYQPKQINILYSLIQWLKKDWKLKDLPWWNGDIFGLKGGKIHVIDFGCGSLATMFAIAIAAAKSYGLSIPVSNIVFDNIDKSRSMTKLGKRTWDEFVSIMTLRHPNHPLCSIFDTIDFKIHLQSHRVGEKLVNSHCFIVAMHCVYEESIKTVRDRLSSLCTHFQPVGVFITSHEFKLDLLNRVSSVELTKTRVEIPNQSHIPSEFGLGKLERTTEWRRLLANKLQNNRKRFIESGLDLRGGINPESISLLRRDVKWNTKSSFKAYIQSDVNTHQQRYIPDDLPF